MTIRILSNINRLEFEEIIKNNHLKCTYVKFGSFHSIYIEPIIDIQLGSVVLIPLCVGYDFGICNYNITNTRNYVRIMVEPNKWKHIIVNQLLRYSDLITDLTIVLKKEVQTNIKLTLQSFGNIQHNNIIQINQKNDHVFEADNKLLINILSMPFQADLILECETDTVVNPYDNMEIHSKAIFLQSKLRRKCAVIDKPLLSLKELEQLNKSE
jgi:hypothetical protein